MNEVKRVSIFIYKPTLLDNITFFRYEVVNDLNLFKERCVYYYCSAV